MRGDENVVSDEQVSRNATCDIIANWQLRGQPAKTYSRADPLSTFPSLLSSSFLLSLRR